jgi:hypothetical protein
MALDASSVNGLDLYQPPVSLSISLQSLDTSSGVIGYLDLSAFVEIDTII